jgi:hypothetical protein
MPVASTRRSYTSTGLIKGTATLDELSTLFLQWNEKESPVLYAKRVLSEGILTKSTSKRVEDLILRVFNPWFLQPTARAARTMKKLVQASAERQVLKEIIFLYKARTEKVLYDYVIERFWNAYDEGFLYLQTVDIEEFLHLAQHEGRVEHSWSSSTQNRLAIGILGAIKEVGFLREEKRYLYTYSPLEIISFTVAYLAYDLHFSGQTDVSLTEHLDWRLFGMNRARVLERLSELDERGGMVVQQAGSVIRVTWLYHSLDEVINAYFG